jgi:dTDP-glucose 4,6-dehydratase
MLFSLLGKPEALMKFVPDRPGHDRRYAIDDMKVRREVGIAPQVPFEEGLRETVRWYLENEEWLRSVRSGEYLKFYDQWYSKQGRT